MEFFALLNFLSFSVFSQVFKRHRLEVREFLLCYILHQCIRTVKMFLNSRSRSRVLSAPQPAASSKPNTQSSSLQV